MIGRGDGDEWGCWGAASSSAAAAADATPLTVDNCQPADGVTGHIEGMGGDAGGGDDIGVRPEIGSGYRSGMRAVKTQNFAVSTANPLSTKAACEVLLNGGTAADALVTAQFMLGLVEPQSSGIGGGGYIVYYDAATGQTVTVDGRETAPAAADENYLINVSAEDTSAPVPDARRSGRSIGVPGAVAALGELHARYGAADWAADLQPAVDAAAGGFEVSPRMAASVAASAKDLAANPNAARYFLDASGNPVAAGTNLVNADYAETVRAIAQQGPQALYSGPIAQAIVDEAARTDNGMTPSLMTVEDVAAYKPVWGEAVCAPYRDVEVCGMPPSSSGPVTVLETLRLLDGTNLAQYAPESVGADGALPNADAVHLISEAERLAYADRDAYIADPAFVKFPYTTLLSDDYIVPRRGLLDAEKSMGTAKPGAVDGWTGEGSDLVEHGTSHISVIDAQGNAASMTTSVEAAFGSFHFTNGFILNNQLTDFNAQPLDAAGQPAANRVQAGKRPRSSMAPLLVFDRLSDASSVDASSEASSALFAGSSGGSSAGGSSVGSSRSSSAGGSSVGSSVGGSAAGSSVGGSTAGSSVTGGATPTHGPLRMVLGSPGGSVIIQYNVKTLVNILDWGMDPQQAVSSPNFGARNTPTTGIGGEHPLMADSAALVSALETKGHTVDTATQTSGLSALVVTDEGIVGGADPRREGIVLGD